MAILLNLVKYVSVTFSFLCLSLPLSLSLLYLSTLLLSVNLSYARTPDRTHTHVQAHTHTSVSSNRKFAISSAHLGYVRFCSDSKIWPAHGRPQICLDRVPSQTLLDGYRCVSNACRQTNVHINNKCCCCTHTYIRSTSVPQNRTLLTNLNYTTTNGVTGRFFYFM